MYTNSFHTSQRTHLCLEKSVIFLIYYHDAVAVYFKNHAKYNKKLSDGKQNSFTLQHVAYIVTTKLKRLNIYREVMRNSRLII
jgi:hypothetical protein